MPHWCQGHAGDHGVKSLPLRAGRVHVRAQVFRQQGDAWRLEASDGLAVLASHKPLIVAALADARYDKIVHVRQVRPGFPSHVPRARCVASAISSHHMFWGASCR